MVVISFLTLRQGLKTVLCTGCNREVSDVWQNQGTAGDRKSKIVVANAFGKRDKNIVLETDVEMGNL